MVTPAFWVDRTAYAIVHHGYDSLSISEESALQYNTQFREAVMQRVRELEGKTGGKERKRVPPKCRLNNER